MKLKIKPIINGLFHATITQEGFQEGFEATAIGHTKDEAAKKALERLKREVEISCKAESSAIENDDNDLEDIEDTFDADEQKIYSGEFLNGEVWKGLEEEVQRLAMQVAKVALKATYRPDDEHPRTPIEVWNEYMDWRKAVFDVLLELEGDGVVNKSKVTERIDDLFVINRSKGIRSNLDKQVDS